MIDWYNLIMNACWILGCAVALTTLSYASWEASAQREKFPTHLKGANFQIALNAGGILFCSGLAGTSELIWQKILWIILAIGFMAQIFVEIYRRP